MSDPPSSEGQHVLMAACLPTINLLLGSNRGVDCGVWASSHWVQTRVALSLCLLCFW
jgi:hypothetical protein